MKKRIMLALVVALVMFGVVYASAASLDVFGGFIQAGNDGDLRCDLDGVRVAGWGLETTDNTVRSVRLHGVSAACDGAEMFVTIDRVSGPDLYPAPVTLNGTEATNYGFSFGPSFPTPQEIIGINVYIEGADPVSIN